MSSPGVFRFGYAALSISMSFFSPPVLAQLPPATQAAVTIDVDFRSGSATLAGTILVPPNPIAGVVIVHGSGQTARDLAFAQELAQRGVATLTYDKRGAGKSGGVYVGPEVGTNNVDTANLELVANDAVAATSEVSRRISSPPTPIGLIGMSQAGWVIPLAAVRSPDVKFMVIWSGPLVTTLEQLRFQFFTEDKKDFWTKNTEAGVREHIRSGPDRYQFLPTDPAASLSHVSIPGLWLYGLQDLSVPVSLSIERLDSLKSSGKRFSHIEFADAGHELPFSSALSASINWIQRTIVPVPQAKK